MDSFSCSVIHPDVLLLAKPQVCFLFNLVSMCCSINPLYMISLLSLSIARPKLKIRNNPPLSFLSILFFLLGILFQTQTTFQTTSQFGIYILYWQSYSQCDHNFRSRHHSFDIELLCSLQDVLIVNLSKKGCTYSYKSPYMSIAQCFESDLSKFNNHSYSFIARFVSSQNASVALFLILIVYLIFMMLIFLDFSYDIWSPFWQCY